MIHTLQWSKTEERHQLRRHFRGDPTQHRGQWAVTLGGQGLRGLTKAPVPMSTETRLCSLQDCFPSRETPDSLGLRVFTAECMSGTERDYSRRDLNVKKWPKILGEERMEGRSCALKHIHAQHNRPLPFLSVAFTKCSQCHKGTLLFLGVHTKLSGPVGILPVFNMRGAGKYASRLFS